MNTSSDMEELCEYRTCADRVESSKNRVLDKAWGGASSSPNTEAEEGCHDLYWGHCRETGHHLGIQAGTTLRGESRRSAGSYIHSPCLISYRLCRKTDVWARSGINMCLLSLKSGVAEAVGRASYVSARSSRR